MAVLAAGRTSSWLMVVQANLGSELTLFFGSAVLTCRWPRLAISVRLWLLAE